MRVLFAGTPAVALPSLEALLAAGFDVVGVLTRPDAPIGRKRVLAPSPVAARAEELGLPIIRANRLDTEVQEQIALLRPEVAAIVAYGALVPPAALTIPDYGWINLHFSLLPAWRGAAPVQHAVINGDDVTGAVTFQLEAGLDTGPVFGTVTEFIRRDDTGSALLTRLSHSGSVLLTQTLSAVAAGTATAIEQTGPVSLAPKLTIEDGRIDFSVPALAVSRRIRGVTEEPGAWTVLAGQRFKVAAATLRPDRRELAPGQLAQAGKSLLVGTGSHAIELLAVQPAGKKMMDAADWLRGVGMVDGMVFGE
ncbi:methionyl-tRNA formyltransferase [Renibacterium salmoninarum ATCC 33209]|uniref:Methionyl-tRNA formyltransferase n=1 Tax=Renibacterium salmoninarum (strain ATCC 33209 / DSM 20767 / JCM 11484 / NBRC 15589 / NCIMB 2235) TaxID=288705 RepID=FMT_RENSM|nr:methionyl-tRNA formyltransferase [Renibacterium salmoninarum]A9WR74.1 RecName: Full=Methionyl-tRNA formyltransferase [Renibacterium salmoninarum ATCC 33209]ABY24083.1 methionyl-tRNA formyltransferase [Renibacterium salmoninarum ATCC 33209]